MVGNRLQVRTAREALGLGAGASLADCVEACRHLPPALFARPSHRLQHRGRRRRRRGEAPPRSLVWSQRRRHDCGAVRCSEGRQGSERTPNRAMRNARHRRSSVGGVLVRRRQAAKRELVDYGWMQDAAPKDVAALCALPGVDINALKVGPVAPAPSHAASRPRSESGGRVREAQSPCNFPRGSPGCGWFRSYGRRERAVFWAYLGRYS